MAIETKFLNSIPYFKGLKHDELDIIKNLLFEKRIERGGLILLEGVRTEALYFVFSGAVKTFRTSADGKEQVLNIVRPGESFNDVAVFDNGTNLASAKAMSQVMLYGILKNDLLALCGKYPQIGINSVNVLSSQMRYFVSLIDELSFKPVLARVAKILYEYVGNGSLSGERLTQQDMAAIAGTVRELVGRSLKTLESSGAIKFDRHRIVITDKDTLKNIAGIS